MIASMRDNDVLQMNAYCDGELDPASAIEFERRLVADESLKAQHNRLLALRRNVRSLPQYDVPAGLQARIQSALDADRPGQASRSSSGQSTGPGGKSASTRLVVSGVGCGSDIWRGDLEFSHADDGAL